MKLRFQICQREVRLELAGHRPLVGLNVSRQDTSSKFHTKLAMMVVN